MYVADIYGNKMVDRENWEETCWHGKLAVYNYTVGVNECTVKVYVRLIFRHILRLYTEQLIRLNISHPIKCNGS